MKTYRKAEAHSCSNLRGSRAIYLRACEGRASLDRVAWSSHMDIASATARLSVRAATGTITGKTCSNRAIE
jgi:hypothetical protein